MHEGPMAVRAGIDARAARNTFGTAPKAPDRDRV